MATPRLPRSLKILRKICVDLFVNEHSVLACETQILIENNGDVYPEKVSMFLLHYDLSLVYQAHYLWDELLRIEWGIKASGYTHTEIEELDDFMTGMVTGFESGHSCLDLSKASVIDSLHLLN
jgi:hypothetical protein